MTDLTPDDREIAARAVRRMKDDTIYGDEQAALEALAVKLEGQAEAPARTGEPDLIEVDGEAV